ncbi:MAG: class I SAM-dependent methyltransferase [Anaerolineae bacterium]
MAKSQLPTREALLLTTLQRCPAAAKALRRAKGIPGQLLPYQAAALYSLVCSYDTPGAQILEIGTAAGYSAAVMAQAASRAQIVTVNAAGHQIPTAVENFLPWPNVQVCFAVSWELLATYDGPEIDVVFVDGDHRRALRDVPWFNRLTVGGLLLFHDYTRAGSLPVVEAVQALAARLERQPDVVIEDAQGVGMAGFYRRMDETW